MKDVRSFIALDLETTGLRPKEDKILEIGAIKVRNGIEVERFQLLTDPQTEIPEQITKLTGITQEMVQGRMPNGEAVAAFLDFAEELPLLGHNISFDYRFLKYQAVNQGKNFERKAIDTLKISRCFLSNLESRKLEDLCVYYGICNPSAHRALADAWASWQLFEKLWTQFGDQKEEVFIPQPLIYKVKKQYPITKAQVRYLQNLLNCHKIETDLAIESLSRNEASRMIDRILSVYGKIQRKDDML